MLKPLPAYAALDPDLIRRPRLVPVDFTVETPATAPASRWREDLRFFLVCYFTAFVLFLFLLG